MLILGKLAAEYRWELTLACCFLLLRSSLLDLVHSESTTVLTRVNLSLLSISMLIPVMVINSGETAAELFGDELWKKRTGVQILTLTTLAILAT